MRLFIMLAFWSFVCGISMGCVIFKMKRHLKVYILMLLSWIACAGAFGIIPLIYGGIK